MVVVRVLAVVAGAGAVAAVMLSAIRTVVLPRSEVVRLSRFAFIVLRRIFDVFAREQRSYEARDRVMAMYGPLGLILLPGMWAVLVVGSFSFIFWGLGVSPARTAFSESTSSFTTLGFSAPTDLPTTIASFAEAVLGLGLIALLISYLPSIYASFQRRELAVSMLEVRAGSPPTAMALLRRHHQIGWLQDTGSLYADWEIWFADIGETHTSQGTLAFFRSPLPHRSWITAAGAVLDAAALNLSVVEVPWDARAALCLRSGFLSLRHIADFFAIPYDPDPTPDSPISVAREEFDKVCGQLADAGVPLKADRDKAWRDFAGWRVNYDEALVNLAGLTMAPYAPWSSDRSIRYRVRPPVVGRVGTLARRSAGLFRRGSGPAE